MKANNYSLLRKTISDKRDSLVFNLSDSELKSLFSGKTIKEKMINFFTLKRSKRLELIKKGYIVFGLVFSSSYINNSNLIRTRIIFSPSYELADNKEEMLAIADKINEWVDSVNFKKLTMKEKKLYQAIISDEEEPNYIQIPESIIGNKLVYLSLIFVNKDDFLNGMVPIIINRKISKEILLVPSNKPNGHSTYFSGVFLLRRKDGIDIYFVVDMNFLRFARNRFFAADDKPIK